MSPDPIRPARQLLRSLRSGVLSTHSVRFVGHPFGSALPYAVDPAGRPLLLISDLAAHTHNLRENPAASLCAHQADVITGGRVTLVGDAVRVDDPDALARFVRLVPAAAGYAGFGDFHLYRLEPVGGHYVGGFGTIHGFDRDAWVVAVAALATAEADIVEHMNQDHMQTLREYCRHQHSLTPGQVEMLTIDADGFDVMADGSVLRFAFEQPVTDAAQARAQLVAMAHAARANGHE